MQISLNNETYEYTGYHRTPTDLEVNVVYNGNKEIEVEKFYWVVMPNHYSHLAYCNSSSNGNLSFDILTRDDEAFFDTMRRKIERDNDKVVTTLDAADSTDILNYIGEFISGSVFFTSVDISNAVKRDGKWVRNRRVCDVLNYSDFVTNLLRQTGYTVYTRFNANGDNVSIYGPLNANPDDYPGLDQKILTPNDVATNANIPPAPLSDPNQVMAILNPSPVIMNALNNDSTTLTASSNGDSTTLTVSTTTSFDGSKYVYYY